MYFVYSRFMKIVLMRDVRATEADSVHLKLNEYILQIWLGADFSISFTHLKQFQRRAYERTHLPQIKINPLQ